MHGISSLRLFRALALVGAAFVLLVNAAGAQGVSPVAVVDSFERDWSQQDLDAALDRFGDAAVLTIYEARTRSLTTRAEIRDFLAVSLQSRPQRTSTRNVDGTTVVWHERFDGTDFLNARELTVQAIVEDGKIQSLSYRPGRVVALAGVPAPSVTAESATLATGGLLLLGLGLLTLATVRQHARSGSNLDGKLLRELRHYAPRKKAVSSFQ